MLFGGSGQGQMKFLKFNGVSQLDEPALTEGLMASKRSAGLSLWTRVSREVCVVTEAGPASTCWLAAEL